MNRRESESPSSQEKNQNEEFNLIDIIDDNNDGDPTPVSPFLVLSDEPVAIDFEDLRQDGAKSKPIGAHNENLSDNLQQIERQHIIRFKNEETGFEDVTEIDVDSLLDINDDETKPDGLVDEDDIYFDLSCSVCENLMKIQPDYERHLTVRVLYRLISNLIRDPYNLKYRKLSTDNKVLLRHVFVYDEAVSVLHFIGFQEHSLAQKIHGNSPFWTIPTDPPDSADLVHPTISDTPSTGSTDLGHDIPQSSLRSLDHTSSSNLFNPPSLSPTITSSTSFPSSSDIVDSPQVRLWKWVGSTFEAYFGEACLSDIINKQTLTNSVRNDDVVSQKEAEFCDGVPEKESELADVLVAARQRAKEKFEQFKFTCGSRSIGNALRMQPGFHGPNGRRPRNCDKHKRQRAENRGEVGRVVTLADLNSPQYEYEMSEKRKIAQIEKNENRQVIKGDKEFPRFSDDYRRRFPTPRSIADLRRIDSDPEYIGRLALDYTNDYRRLRGLYPFYWSPALFELGNEHSDNMALGLVPMGHQGSKMHFYEF